MNDTTLLVALEEPTLKKLSSIQHAFFTRQGGVSGKNGSDLDIDKSR